VIYRSMAAVLTPLLGGRVERHSIGPVDLRVRVFGTQGGEPWVLLHGLGSTAFTWVPMLKELSADCRVLLPELTIQGGTRAPHRGLNVQEASSAIATMIERRFEGRPVTLGGISLGGWTAVRIALERPELVDRLLLVACAGYLDQDWNRVVDLVTVQSRADAGAMLEALFQRPPLRFRWGRSYVNWAFNSRHVRHVLDTIHPGDVFDADDLARITQPTGVIWGERDGLFPPEVGRAIDAALPHSRLEVIPGCGHVVPWDCPAAANRALRDIRDGWAGEAAGAAPPA
jgi:pimeloyl-ACP methyl ester carboxylesterase